MPPTLTKDDWCTLLASIILVAILPAWLVLLLPFTPIIVIALIGGIFLRGRSLH
jgi:hypothetical protein